MNEIIHRTKVLLDFRAAIFRYNEGLTYEQVKHMCSGIDGCLDQHTDSEIAFGAAKIAFRPEHCKSNYPRVQAALERLNG